MKGNRFNKEDYREDGQQLQNLHICPLSGSLKTGYKML